MNRLKGYKRIPISELFNRTLKNKFLGLPPYTRPFGGQVELHLHIYFRLTFSMHSIIICVFFAAFEKVVFELGAYTRLQKTMNDRRKMIPGNFKMATHFHLPPAVDAVKSFIFVGGRGIHSLL